MAYAFVYVTNTTGDYLPVDVAFASDDSSQILVRGLDQVAVCSNPNDDPSDGCEVAIVNVARTAGGPGVIQNRGGVTLPPGVSLLTVKVFNGCSRISQGQCIDPGGWATRIRVEDPATQEEFRRGEIEYSVTP
jgi:hypothetical protein